MKRFLLPFVVLCAIVSLCSCLGDNDNEIEYNEDTAITAFSLGTLNRYLHTKSSTNTDSIYKTTVTGSNYKFYIDQVKQEIYNPDSLPYGTDAAHVICTISTKNSGTVLVKSMTSDSLSYYNSTDSLNFTSPRTMYVYSNSGQQRREYTIRVNVHQEEADSFCWKALNNQSELAALQTMKGMSVADKVLVFGNNGDNTVLFSTSQQDGNSWTKQSRTFSADAYKNVVKKDGVLYLKDGNKLLSCADGSNWTELREINVRQLVAASTVALYAIGQDGKLISSYDDGATWTTEQLDDDQLLLPAQDISYSCLPSKTNEKTDQLVLVGSRDINTYPDDAFAELWGKVEEYASGAATHSWSYYDVKDDIRFRLPRLSNLTVVPYVDVLLALGGDGIGACDEKGFSQLYVSQDGGINWKTSAYFPLPEGLSSSNTSFTVMVDDSRYIWIVCGGTGQVWRGRLNKYGWSDVKKSFTE